MQTQTKQVLVVGGGPVGLFTAALLDAAGVEVEVFERERTLPRHTKGITIHPRTLEVLSVLRTASGVRLSEVLVDAGVRSDVAHFAALPDRLAYANLDTPFPFVLMVPQWYTREVLSQYLTSRGVAVHYGVEVTEIGQNNSSAFLVAGGRRYEAQFVVGADGARSTVRAAAGIDFKSIDPTMVGFVADASATDVPAEIDYIWNDSGYLGITPMGENGIRVFGANAVDVGLTPHQVRERRANPFTLSDLRTSLKNICGSDLGVFDASWLSRATNSSGHADRYRSGRFFLVGDAAHIHLPAAGQGLNVGLQDAANLAWKLAAEILEWAPRELRDGSYCYDSERRPVAQMLVANTLAQDALMNTFGPYASALRDMVSSSISRQGDFAAELAGWVSGIDVSYSPPDQSHRLVGTRAPDLTLSSGTLMSQIRPDRFVLLNFERDGAAALSNPIMNPRVQTFNAQSVGETRSGHRFLWHDVRAALIRPDGYVAFATESSCGHGIEEAVAAWTHPKYLSTQGA